MSSPIPRLRLPRALALTAAAAAFAIVACETALPTNLNAPEPPQAEGTVGADAPAGAVIVERSADGDPVVILDGVVASHDVLRLLDPDRIDRVEVVKGKAALARDERATAGIVEVTTKEHAARIGERRLIELKARESAAGMASSPKLRASDDDYAASAKRIAEVKARAAADGGVKQKADGGEIHPRHGDPAAIGRARFEKASAEGRAASRTMAEQSSQAKTAGTFRFREVEPALEKAKLRRAMESADVWIDGERATKADLAGLETSDIAAIEVLAPGAAAALGVPAGRGLIRITTR